MKFSYFCFLIVLCFQFKTIQTQNETVCCWEDSLRCPNGLHYSPTNPVIVKIGTFINAIPLVDSNNILADFDVYIWLKWDVCQRDYLNALFTPHTQLELTNSLAQNVIVTPTYKYPVCNLFPGQAYWEIRIQGCFLQNFEFHKFPLDCHNVTMEFENSLYSRTQLLFQGDYVPGKYQTSSFKDLTITGWNTISTNILQSEQPSYYYTSDFEVAYGTPEYSNYRFSIQITRGASLYVLKVIPPAFFAIGVGFLCILLDIESMDSRVQVISGIIVGLIFLQLFFDTGANAGNYLTIVDWVFNVSYLFSVSLLVECIVASNYYLHKMKIVDSYESEIGILKYTKDELAPVSKHLRKKQKSEAEKAKKKNKFSLKNILAKLAGETKKKKKKKFETISDDREHIGVEEQILRLSEKAKEKKDGALDKVTRYERLVFSILLACYILFVIFLTVGLFETKV